LMLRESKGEEGVAAGYDKLCDDHPHDLEILELYAEYLTRNGDVPGLLKHRKRMLAEDPHHVPSLLSLGKLELSRDKTTEANTYFEQAISAGPEHASTYRDIALVYLDQGNLQRAGELLTHATVLDPEDADTALAMARLAEEYKDPKQTETLLKKALDLSPANEKMLRLLGDFYFRQDRLPEAAQVYEQVLAVENADPKAMLVLAGLYLDLEDKEALDRLQKKLGESHEGGPGVELLADYAGLASEFGEWNRARWSLEKALEIVPEDLQLRRLLASAYVGLGEKDLAEKAILDGKKYAAGEKAQPFTLALVDLYSMLDEPEKALSHMREVAGAEPDNIEYQHRLILFLLMTEIDREAEIALNELLKKFAVGQPVETQLIRAEVFRARKDHDRAISVLKPLLDEHEEEASRIHFDLAVTYAEKKDLAGAEKHYEAAIELCDKAGKIDVLAVNSLNNLAYLYATDGINLDKAEELARRALSYYPRGGYIMDTLGWVKFQKKDYQEAEKWLKKAEKRSMADAEIFEHLGDLYRETDRPRLARDCYERALEQDPRRVTAADKLDALKIAMEAAPAPAAP
ncbi:tetratricopeptide repeat protein, partial [Candidatus Poribacteria bacterium]|nr:tetratricopeptide repeat protein [Candidatus Poribacteria bacterium]